MRQIMIIAPLILEQTALLFESMAMHCCSVFLCNALYEFGVPCNGLYGCAFVFESSLKWPPHIIR